MSQLIPHALEIEKSVLGSMLCTEEIMEQAVEQLKPVHFFDKRNRTLFAAIKKAADKNQSIDPQMLAVALEGKVEIAYISEIMENVSTSSNIDSYTGVLIEKAVKRQLIKIGETIVAGSKDPEEASEAILDSAEMKFIKLAEAKELPEQKAEKLGDLLSATFSNMEKAKVKGGVPGIKTGIDSLDQKVGGFQKSDLIIVAARPSMGKTSLALSMAANMAIDNTRVGVFSLEMPKEQLVQRFLCMESGVSIQKIRNNTYTKYDLQELGTAAGKIQQRPIWIDDTAAITISQLRSKARRMRRQYRIEVLIVDYLQLMSGSTETVKINRNAQLEEVSRGLKQIAKDFDIPVVALSQLSRAVEQRSDREPMLSDLRDSGSIEQDADMVIFPFRPATAYGGENKIPSKIPKFDKLIIGKNRSGPNGYVPVTFLDETATFVGADEPEAEPEMEDF